MELTFRETRVAIAEGIVQLLDRAGAVILELRDGDIRAAIDRGYIDADCSHASVFEYARVVREFAPLP